MFLSEPPPPRTIRRAAAEAGQEVSLLAEEVMECIVEALTLFPDAYRAVLRALKERRAQRREAQASPVTPTTLTRVNMPGMRQVPGPLNSAP